MLNLIALLFAGNTITYQAYITPEIHALEAPRQLPQEEPLTPLENDFRRVFGASSEVMWKIAACESQHRQFDSKGKALIGFTGDIGILQIAPQYWLKEAQRLGHDIYTLEGNLQMAQVIKERQGLNAWVCYKEKVRFMET